MTIALLLLAALFLTVTMLVLTVGVNDLEKKGAELSSLIRKRYAVAAPKPKATAAAGTTPAKAP